jgi:hypothetical protein
MILNLSIGEEVERADAKQLEGKIVQQDDDISPVATHSAELQVEKVKNDSKDPEISV